MLRFGDRVRITAQLIQAASDRHLWAHTYEGSLREVLELQNLVAADIADQIRIKLTPHERAVLKSTRIARPAAYEAYFKGRYFWDLRSTQGITKAMHYFEEAVREDPTFALPYAALAEVYAGLPTYMAIPPRESTAKPKSQRIRRSNSMRRSPRRILPSGVSRSQTIMTGPLRSGSFAGPLSLTLVMPMPTIGTQST